MLRDARITPKARGDVEDALLVLRDENVALKRKINTFEDRTKILTAKVQRLTDGFRRASNVDNGLIDARDEDSFVDLRKRFDDVAKENMLLKKKVQYFKTMHEAETRKRVPYGHIPPRINTNQKKFHPALRIKDGGSPTPVTSTAQTATIPISNEEIEKLTNLVNSLRGKLNTAEADLDHHKSIGDEARAQLAKIQQRSDIELLSLQKENAQKGKAILDIRKELSTMDEKYRAMTEAYNRAVDTIDVLNDEVKGERGRVQILEETLKTQKMAAKREAELEEIIRDLRAEKEMLEVEQKRLLKFQFGRIREEELQQKIDDLQSSLLNVSKDRREWLDERGRLLRKIKELQDEHGAFAEDKKSGDALINQLKLELENATERLKLYEKNGQLDFSDIEEALAIIQLRKQKGITLDFLLQVEDHYEDKKLLHDLRQQFADCVQEVRTLRKMLKTQEQITKDVKLELNEKERELNGMKNEYELRLDELSRLLDTRAAKLAMLEAELKAISQKTFDVTPFSTEEVESGSDIKLEIGQNMFEVHIDSASISENILQSLKTDVSPNQLTTFIYFDFFDFETQLTPLGLGLKPHFNHTARFITDADNMLFKYLQSNPCLLHFCVSNGTKYEEIGVCRVTYMDLLALEKVERKRYYGEIVSIRDGTLVGKLDYSLLAYVPMSRAIEAYRERQHASRSLAKSSDLSITTGDFGALLHHSNELIITVEGCKSLRLSVDKERNIPAIYAMFQLFDLAPMFTDVVRGNNIQNPVFSLRKVVSLPVSMRLHQYLLEEELSVYVVAEKMSEGVGVVYGIARIKLSGLAFGHSLSGEFNLLDDYGVVCGTIMVQLKWGKSYQNPVDARREEETEIDHTRPPSPANEHPSPSNRFETSTEQGKR
ncbi:hypothetical protein BJ742DRAFT_217394 [Cladochytrium replicatum]|nr:hypothetical protein BJ742DRAFT_217394 [Cladochytrium replicatum]